METSGAGSKESLSDLVNEHCMNIENVEVERPAPDDIELYVGAR